MGDRGNIVVRQTPNTNKDDVWFYTHWSGSEICEIARTALARRQRWEDSTYLARIVFDELTKGCQGDETGFGISTSIGDNSHPIVVIDCPDKRVYRICEPDLDAGRLPHDSHTNALDHEIKSFDDFIAANHQQKG